MTGEVLYRKWRPPRFANIVGQGPITQTLAHAVATNRVAHAYLLCGPRGTGKTSTARVLAKSLNCTMRPPGVGDPCDACDSCLAIGNGSFLDLIEIDAGSARRIEDMRSLIEKVRFAPTYGKYKVYIIDEAHALTGFAADAFLKTLEEPPPSTVFILATTEPHGLPPTITSRCQRFDFHRIAPSAIAERLQEITQDEGVDASPEMLRLIARSCEGSLRDATNILDQLITSFGARVNIEQVRTMVGADGEDRALALVQHLLTGNTSQALEIINARAAEGLDLRSLHRMTVNLLRAALLMKSGVRDSLELSEEALSDLSATVPSISLEHITRALRLFGQASLRFDQSSPLPLELATVELGLESLNSITGAAPQPQPKAAAPQPQPSATPGSIRESASTPTWQPPPREQAIRPSPMPAADPSTPLEQRLATQWTEILRALNSAPRRKMSVSALLRSSTRREIEGTTLIVRFPHISNSERLQDELDDPRCRLEVERVLHEALGTEITVRVDTDGTRNTDRNGDKAGHVPPIVEAALNLGGRVIAEDLISPVPAGRPDAAQSPPNPTGDEVPSTASSAPKQSSNDIHVESDADE